MNIQIRIEQSRDIEAIHKLNHLAFGQEQEASLVDALRDNHAVLLSAVATIEDKVVGHILYSPATIGEGEQQINGASLAPMAVLPEYQNQGIGSKLVEYGNAQMQQQGMPFVIVLGHPDYYPRFGFVPASNYGVSCQWEVPDEVFMIKILDQTKMDSISGLARYRDEFNSVS